MSISNKKKRIWNTFLEFCVWHNNTSNRPIILVNPLNQGRTHQILKRNSLLQLRLEIEVLRS
ncbi:MAG: hypothetical protein KDD70_11315 [Bdellovibrionales bacterium]|nr:hypothetical protein [Bdellovibrionales bacterium]